MNLHPHAEVSKPFSFKDPLSSNKVYVGYPSIADGVVTKSVGELTYKLMSKVVDEVVLVGEDSIARAMFLLMERAKLVVEGAGALPVAALLEGYAAGAGKNIVAVISGGNADLTTIYRVILKGLSVDGRVTKLTLILDDVPGALYRVLEVLAKYRCNVLDIRHDRVGIEVPASKAIVEIVFEVPEKNLLSTVEKELSQRATLITPSSQYP